jgi:hypothetical protein
MAAMLSVLRHGWPPSDTRNIPGIHLCHGLSWPQGYNANRRIRSIRQHNFLIGNPNRALLACSIPPQTALPPCVPRSALIFAYCRVYFPRRILPIYIYCDVFGRMPPLLCNRKLDTPVVARQLKVKHLHGYATVVLHSNQQWESRVFLLGQPDIIKGRQ